MKCKHCGTENAPLKKQCNSCGKILEGECVNNVTGEMGYRNSDGSFTTYEELRAERDKCDELYSKIEKEIEDKLFKPITEDDLLKFMKTGIYTRTRRIKID